MQREALKGWTYILNEPVDPVTVVQLLMVRLGKKGLLPESSNGEEASQALTEVTENRGHGQRVQPLELS